MTREQLLAAPLPGQGESAVRLGAFTGGRRALPRRDHETVFHEQGKSFLHTAWRDLTRMAEPTAVAAPSKQKGEKP
jgi:hypothetical protein